MTRLCCMRLPFLIGIGTVASTASFQHALSTGADRIALERTRRINVCRRTSTVLWACEDTDEEIPMKSLEYIKEQKGSRRMFMASALVAAGALVAPDDSKAVATFGTEGSLPWKIDPVNKRSGVTVFDAEKVGYNVAFVTYLSRFLLNFDANCQRWWFSTGIPKNSTPLDIEKLRINQFAAFSASVEVGLQGYECEDGPAQLLEDLRQRYGKVPGSLNDATSESEDNPNKTQRRLARSARRQIALLFGLLDKNQPVKEITGLLASVDNGGISSVQLLTNETFAGYEMSRPPNVIIPPPEAGDNYVAAEGRVVLKPTGRLLRLDIVDAGSGYATSPVVSIISGGDTATEVQAKIATKGPNKGSLESVQLIDTGSGYTSQSKIQIKVSQPELAKGRVAVLSPVLDMMVDSVKLTRFGTGYAAEKPLRVFLEQPSAVTGSKSDPPLQVGVAYPTADQTSFTAFRRDSDKKNLLDLEDEFEVKYNIKPPVSGIDTELPPLPFWNGGKSKSAELLRLLPAGIGLEYDPTLKRYALAADTEFLTKYPAVVQQSSSRNFGFEYGPRGRAPIERDMQLDLPQYLRFALSGSICASGVHVALTPLDVVKTKGQVDPIKYPNIGSSIKTVWEDEGPSTLFTGWLPTYLGNFAGGGALYTVTEITRRYLSEAAGVDAVTLEVPIILIAAAIASSFNSVLICPFEAVRIRSVAQPEFADNSIEVFKRMLNEEGIGSLLNAIPVFLARNIPYAMVKFLVFDLSTEKLYEQFPAAQEELKLSLLVSLVGGILGGTAAAIISNPADTVVSELKKAKSDISPFEAISNMIERAGPSAFFVGLPLRMLFYSLIASMTFVVYDGVRFLLGIGSQDLKLYLDVLGGALNDSPLV